jgi:hypothetical protein
MNRETKKALRESIKHWERMRDRKVKPRENSESPDGDECALCRITDHNCSRCPVWADTGRWSCVTTPYHAALNAWWTWTDEGGRKYREFWRKHAQAEIDYLKGLLKR